MESNAASSSAPSKPMHYWRTLILQYLLTVFVIGGLEAVCLMDWRSLFWAVPILAVLRLHAAFWKRLLPKRFLPLGILAGCVLILMPLCVLHFIVWAYWLNPIAISKETTFITEPLTPNGKRVDFFAALEQRLTPKTPPEENGFRLMVQELGPAFALDCSLPVSDYSKQRWLKLCDKLNLVFPDRSANDWAFEFPNLRQFLEEREETMNPEPKDSDAKNHKAWADALNEKYRRLAQTPWSAAEFSDAAEWIEKNKKAFDLLGEAVRMPVFFEPFLQDREDDSLEPFYFRSQSWQIVRHLPFRVQYYLGRGEMEKAWYDVMTQYRFAFWRERFSYHPSQIWYLHSIEPATAFLEHGLEHGHLTPENIRRYHDEIKPFLSPTDRDILDNQKFGGHLLSLDFLLRFTYSWGWRGVGIPRLFAWNQSLRKINTHFDRAWQESLEKAALPDRHVMDSFCIHQHSDITPWHWIKSAVWYGPFKFFPSIIADEILKKTEPAEHLCCCPLPLQGYDVRRQSTQKAMTGLAFELARYQAEHGTYPETLRMLETAGVLDPYGQGNEFCYERLPQNGYRLCSVGRNGIDDLGIEDYENKKDDIMIQMP